MSDLFPTGPAPDGLDTPFWEGLREGNLLLPRCSSCETWREPGRMLCTVCHDFATRWDPVPPIGHVYTWARSHRDFVAGLDVRAPYVTVLVELDDAPVRLLGILEDADSIAIGDRVRGVVRRSLNAEWPMLRWSSEVAR